MSRAETALEEKLSKRSAFIGIIGLGYVGLPLAMATARAGFKTLGFDIDPSKIESLSASNSYIEAVSDVELQSFVGSGVFASTCDFNRLAECDVIVICVPTPLSKNMEPDLRFVEETCQAIARSLRSEQLIVLESTTYPGTTNEVVRPILETTGLRSGTDFYLGYSPEREDPGNKSYSTATIPKVISGEGEIASSCMKLFYDAVVDMTIAVSSTMAAEAVKITENVFRSVNIALVNELKVIFDRMDIDVWEVINAASTKPFGYMPFYPGPGLGGHCIPIDPFYLSWKAREYGINTRFIELAGQINRAMPEFVLGKLSMALDQKLGKALSKSKVMILGLAYKRNVSDIRESPALVLLERLQKLGADVSYHDPHVDTIPDTREHSALSGMKSVPLSEENLKTCDAVLVATDHDGLDYRLISDTVPVIVDTRNVFRRAGLVPEGLVKA